MDDLFIELLENNAAHAEKFQSRFDAVQESQAPPVVTVCCSDSRVLQDEMWNNDEPGNIFTCGNIGNRVTQRGDEGDIVSGDVLYPVKHTGTNTIVVVGHTGCGAVTGTYDDLTSGLDEPAGIKHCLGLLAPHLRAGVELLDDHELSRKAAIDRLVEYNVDRQIDVLTESDEIPDSVRLIGVVYDFQDSYSGRRGEVHVINVDGERDVEQLQTDHPEIEAHIERLWSY